MIDDIAAAFNAEDATLDVMVSHGFGPDGLPSGADIENRIRNDKLVRVLVGKQVQCCYCSGRCTSS